MSLPRTACCLLLVFSGAASALYAQAEAPAGADAAPMRLQVSVDEVALTFHATDKQGQAVTDLKLSDLTIYDEDKEPAKVLDFESLPAIPVRVGILFDTSASMTDFVFNARAVAEMYAHTFLRPEADSAFVEDFGYISRIVQSWTKDPAVLTSSIRDVHAGTGNLLGGTALFDTVASACLYQFGKTDRPSSGSFILLFSDGEDNASQLELRRSIDICQRAETAVYVFRPSSRSDSSIGTRNLVELTAQTGGEIFPLDAPAAEIKKDLSRIDAGVRNQYWLVYRPAALQHNGQFHHIYVGASSNHVVIGARTGYYAPDR